MARVASKATVETKQQGLTPKTKPSLMPNAPAPQSHGPSFSLLQRAALAPLSLTQSDLLRLQRSGGKQTIQRLINRPDVRPARAIRVNLPSFRPMAQLQAKLMVGPVGDRYEQEADRVAQQVMRMPAIIQRHGEDEEVQMKPETALERYALTRPTRVATLTQRSSQTDGGTFAPGQSFESQLRRTRGGGRPIPDSTRTFMESRMGADFSSVRLHTNQQAVQLSREINAQAFTLGSNIYFGEGKANLASGSGRRLLAHELTHTVQQGAAPVQRKHQGRTAAGKLQMKAGKTITPVVQRLVTGAKFMQNLALGQGLVEGKSRAKPAEISWWRRKTQSEATLKNHLIERFRVALAAIDGAKATKSLQLQPFYKELSDLNKNEEGLKAKSSFQLQMLLGQAEAIQKGLAMSQSMGSPKLKSISTEFMKAYENYLKVTADSKVEGLLRSPEFVLDQVFQRPGAKGSGASAGNLDVGVGDSLAAHYELKMTTISYVAKLRQLNEPELANVIEEYLPEIDQEKEYMYFGLKNNRHKSSMQVADAINAGRSVFGKSDLGDVSEEMTKKGDALDNSTPLGLFGLDNIPGAKTLSPTHLKWLQDDEAKKSRQPEEKKEGPGPEEKKGEEKEDKTDFSTLRSMERTLGKGAEGEVTLYESYKMQKLHEEDTPEAIPDKQFAVKTTRSAARENLLKEYAAYKHVGPHRNLPKVHGMAAIQFAQDKRAGMIMDFVKGQTGERAMKLLRDKGMEGKIGPKQYWGTIQFITRRLVEVIKHLNSKGIAHNDIKPENFMIDEQGEPVMLDLGVHSVKGAPARRGGMTEWFGSRELTRTMGEDDTDVASGEETDMFLVAGSMLAGVEGWKKPENWNKTKWAPNKGLDAMTPDIMMGRVSGGVGSRDMDAEYSKFMRKVLGNKELATITIAEAEREPFLSDPLISDDEAKLVLVKVRKDEEDSRREEAKPVTEPVAAEAIRQAMAQGDEEKARQIAEWDVMVGGGRSAPRVAGQAAKAVNKRKADAKRAEAEAKGEAKPPISQGSGARRPAQKRPAGKGRSGI